MADQVIHSLIPTLHSDMTTLKSAFFSTPNSATDFNTMKTDGLYKFWYNGSGQSNYNRPTNSSGLLIVFTIGTIVSQTYIANVYPGIVYSRNSEDGTTWNNWTTISAQ